MPNELVPLSKKQGTTDLFADDKFPLVRSSARESDPKRRNPTIDTASLAKKLAVYLPGTNYQKGGPFYVGVFGVAQKRGADDSCLEEIPRALLCLGCPVHVELGAESGWWWPVYDGLAVANAPRIAQDGRFRDGFTVPYKWAKEGSQEALEAAIEFFDAAKDQGYYGPGDTQPQSVVRYTLGGIVTFQQARKRLTINGTTLIPAPTGATDDVNWQTVAAPTPPTPGSGTSVFANDITVVLSGGKSLGKYTNGQIIRSKGKNYEAVLKDIATEEQFPGYTAPQPILASSQQGYVERGTTITPTLTPNFSQGDAGALTSYVLRRNGNQLASDNTAPITYPAFTDSYKIGEETVTYFAQFNFAQGPLKYSDQNNPAPGRINAGSVTAQASIAGAPKIFYGPTASPSDTSAKARALPFSRLTVEGNQFVLNTGTSALTFEIVAPENYTLSVIDLDAFNAPMPYNASALQVQDAGQTAFGHKVWRLTIASAYSASHRHQVTLIS